MSALAFVLLLGAPQVQMVLPKPEQTLPKLEAPLIVIGRIERRLHPRALKRAAALLRVDPLDPDSIKPLGIDLGRPIQVWRSNLQMPPTALVHVADPKALDRALEALAKRHKRVHRLKHKLWDIAITIPLGFDRLVVARIKQRLLLKQLREVPKPEVLAQMLEADLQVPPLKGWGDLLIQINKPDRAEEIEEATVAVVLEPGQAKIDARLTMGLAARVALSGALQRRPAATLLPQSADLVVDAKARLGGAIFTSALLELGLSSAKSEALSKLFAGPVHGQLTKAGGLIVAAQLKKKPPKGWLPSIKPLLEQRAPNAQLELLAPKVLVGALGPVDFKKIGPLSNKDHQGSGAPWSATVRPAPLFQTLMRLSNRKTGLGRGSSRLTLMRMLYGDVLGAIKKIHMTASRRASVVKLSANIHY